MNWIKPSAPCWFMEQDQFLPGLIISTSPLTCQVQQRQFEVKQQQILMRDVEQYPVGDMTDLIDLHVLNEAELLMAIVKRYQSGLYQTYIGPSLLVVNPLQPMPQNASIYRNMHNLKQVAPHIFGIASQALQNLQASHKPQIIVISGESGAGKTENAKLCMRYLATLGQLEKKILQCNPILESFGNAKTLRNNNSSRFGKLIKIYFDDQQRVQGAQIVNYLLEKSRITSPSPNERNFHVFYEFLQGCNTLQNYQLSRQADQYEYLRKSGFYKLANDLSNFNDLMEALQTLGFQEETIFAIVAAVLHMGNIEFEENETGCQIKDLKLVTRVSQYLGVPEKELVRALTTKSRQFGKSEVIDTPLSRAECMNSLQTMARYVYEKLFSYIIVRLNVSLAPEGKHDNWVGLLDIYGFEVFPQNSFEQVLINYTNERLLQLYIMQVFKEEQTIYQSEGLQVSQMQINFTDNQPIIDALDKAPLGIFNIIDDSCAVAGTDETLLAKLRTAHQGSSIVMFPKIAQSTFRVRHSAREVEYNVSGFRTKNKDETSKQLQVLLSKSKWQQMQDIFGNTNKSDKYLGAQIRSEMNELMTELRGSGVHFVRCVKPNENNQLGQVSNPMILNQIRYLGVLETIRIRRDGYSIRRTYQQFYKEFGDMTNYPIYPMLSKNEFKPLTMKIFQTHFAFTGDATLFGNTMLFIKQEAWNAVTQEYEMRMIKKNEMAKRIQKVWKGFKAYVEFRGMLYRITLIQAYCRGFIQRIRFRITISKILYIQHQLRRFLDKCRFHRYKQATKVVQAYFKRVYAIKYVIVESEAVLKIQRFVRMYIHAKRIKVYQEMHIVMDAIQDRSWSVILWRAATRIQKVWKGYFIRNIYEEQVQQIRMAGFLVRASEAAVIIQRHMRGYLCRSHYQRTRQAAYYIQGHFRTKWLSNLFFRVRLAAIIIQRHVRAYQYRTHQTKQILHYIMKPLEADFIRLKEQEFNNLQDGYVESIIDDCEYDTQNRKIDLFSCIIDLEMLTDVSEIYDSLWSTIYKRNFKECYEKNNYISIYSIGEAHTYSVSNLGRVYCWGLNDLSQLGCSNEGRPNTSKISTLPIQKIKCIKAGANHGLYLTSDGQLNTINGVPVLRDVKLLDVYNDTNVCVDESNNIYMWNQHQGRPIELKFKKLQINQISLGLNFMVVLTAHGQVYSMGENSVGELGQQSNRNELVQVDVGEKIVEVHCGMKHTIVRSSLGRVYTWGWGQRGQLGHGNLNDSVIPHIVQLEGKAIQVMAGHKQSMVILESRRIFWWGSNSCLEYQHSPIEYVPSYPPVRIVSSWSRSMSIVFITYANTHKLFENNIKLRNKVLGGLTMKWGEQDILSIDPPYCESLVNYFSHMRKPQIKTNIKFASKIEHQQLMKQLNSQNNTIDCKDHFFSFKDESSVLQQRDMQRQVEEQQNQINPTQPMKQLKQNVVHQQQNDAKLRQLKEVKKRYLSIMNKSEEDYSQLDKEFIQILHDSDLIDILQSIN